MQVASPHVEIDNLVDMDKMYVYCGTINLWGSASCAADSGTAKTKIIRTTSIVQVSFRIEKPPSNLSLTVIDT